LFSFSLDAYMWIYTLTLDGVFSDVPCFKTTICGTPTVWEFDHKNFYVSGFS